MDKALLRLKELSAKIAPRLAEATMDEILDFIQEREELIDQLKDSYSPDLNADDRKAGDHPYRSLVEEIGRYDEPIMARMMELKQEAIEGLARFDQSRMQRNAYEAAYSTESAFIDRRR